jgi:hypothetical protein
MRYFLTAFLIALLAISQSAAGSCLVQRQLEGVTGLTVRCTALALKGAEKDIPNIEQTVKSIAEASIVRQGLRLEGRSYETLLLVVGVSKKVVQNCTSEVYLIKSELAFIDDRARFLGESAASMPSGLPIWEDFRADIATRQNLNERLDREVTLIMERFLSDIPDHEFIESEP